ncbi:MAG: protein kinase, partial [Phycisphaerales bacterium]
TEEGHPYFVMEHVKGIPITEHCDKYKLTIEERLRLFLHVCEAVQHAHQKGIVHRDLKPSNILVTIQDNEGIAKVIDFGVARAISQPLTERTLYTEQGQLVGTPEYMSPEQADLSNQDIDTRTDVYSLGVVLYELLAGVLPFDPKTFREGGIERIRKIIREENPKTPSTRLIKTSLEESTESARRRRTDVRTLRRKLHGDLDWITLKAMEKDRTRRYATVDAMATDICNNLNHQPVIAAPPGVLYRAKKFVRRHQQAVVAAGVALILLAVVLWATRMSIRAGKERAYAQALAHERALAEGREAFEARSGEAQESVNARNLADALAKVQPLLDSPHVAREARLLYAQILLEQQGPVAAVPELKELVTEADGTAGQAHFLLANIYYDADPRSPGETEAYHQLWQQHRNLAEELIAGTAQYYFLQAKATPDVGARLQMLAKALELDGQHYDSLRERAYIYYAQQDYEQMARDASRMIGIQPNNPRGYSLSAIAWRQLGRFEEALQDHTEAIRLAPNDPELYASRWETYTRMGRYELALPDIQKCVRLRPDDILYSPQLVLTLIAMARYDEANKEYNRYVNQPALDRGFGVN